MILTVPPIQLRMLDVVKVFKRQAKISLKDLLLKCSCVNNSVIHKAAALKKVDPERQINWDSNVCPTPFYSTDKCQNPPVPFAPPKSRALHV